MKLNLGSGDKPLEGWENWDIKNGRQIYPLNLPDSHVDELRASHVLEHFPQNLSLKVVAEWVRVLKPGGTLKIAVPDFDWITRAYAEYKDDPQRTALLAGYLMGGQVDEYDYHKAIFTEGRLRGILHAAGLTDIEKWESEIQDCASLQVSLNLQGRKPMPEKAEPDARLQVQINGQWVDVDPDKDFALSPEDMEKYQNGLLPMRTLVRDEIAFRIAGCLSIPRVGFIDCAFHASDILNYAKAQRFVGTGVFWHHALTRSIEHALDWHDAEGNQVDWILTLDYDTFLNPAMLRGMLQTIAAHPEVDALIPLQSKRNTDELLIGGTVHTDRMVCPVETGHFGFTLIRREVFERLSKPWFKETPDDEGRWGEARIDPDIYFWQNMRASGFQPYLALRVPIGHGEEVVSWMILKDGAIKKIYQPVTEWHRTHMPPVEVQEYMGIV